MKSKGTIGWALKKATIVKRLGTGLVLSWQGASKSNHFPEGWYADTKEANIIKYELTRNDLMAEDWVRVANAGIKI